MWSEQKSLELIEVYKNKPVLWNPKDPTYYRKQLKNDGWQEIADSMQMAAEECKNKMTSLLASYRRERSRTRKHQRTGTGSEIYQSTWFAYEAMAFLSDRSNPRKRLNSMMIGDAKIEEDITSIQMSEPSAVITQSSQPPKQKKWQGESTRLEMLSEVLGILKDAPTKSESISNEKFDDECRSFSNFICSKMKKYSETTKSAVQRAITKIIFKADEGYYDYNRTYNQNQQYCNYGEYITAHTHPVAKTSSPSSSCTSQPSPADSQQSVNIEDLI